MKTNRITLFSLCFALLACSIQAHAQGKRKPDEIVAAYKAAHAKQDIRAVMALVSFQSGDKAKRASWERDFLNEFAQPLKSVALAPIAGLLPASFLADVKKGSRPSVELVSCLVVEFASKEEGITASQVYVIGTENHSHFIIGP